MTFENRLSSNSTCQGTLLFVSPPWRGHTSQLIVLAAEMVQRGYRVFFANSAIFQEEIKGNGIGFCLCDPESMVEDSDLVARWRTVWEVASRMESILDGERHIYSVCGEMYGAMHRCLQPIFAEIKPSILVSDRAAFPAQDIANELGIPSVIVGQLLSNFVRADLRYPQLGTPYRVDMTLSQKVVNFLTPLRSFIKLYKPIKRIQRERIRCSSNKSATGSIVLVGGYVGIDFQRQLPPHIKCIGPVIPKFPQRCSPTLLEWLDQPSSLPVVVVSLGTLVTMTRHQIHQLALGLTSSEFRVLWSLPSSQQALLPTLPVTFRIETHVPMLTVLSHSAVLVFVNHGGTNSIMEGLYFGKPMLAVPFFGDHYYNAARLVDSGAGLSLPKSLLNETEIRLKIKELLTSSVILNRVVELSRLQKAADGRVKAADYIENVLKLKLL